jgi:hypothetical protein
VVRVAEFQLRCIRSTGKERGFEPGKQESKEYRAKKLSLHYTQIRPGILAHQADSRFFFS